MLEASKKHDEFFAKKFGYNDIMVSPKNKRRDGSDDKHSSNNNSHNIYSNPSNSDENIEELQFQKEELELMEKLK